MGAGLAFVMLGAIAVYSIAYRVVSGHSAPLLGETFLIPERKDIDRNLIVGAAMFGAGWGLAGFCPGPAITSLASGAAPVALFVIAMVAGIHLHGAFARLAEIGMRPARLAAQIAAVIPP